VLPEKGIVEYVMMMDCKEDMLYAVFEYFSINHFPLQNIRVYSTNNESSIKVIAENIQ
jgi:hypothetical protein